MPELGSVSAIIPCFNEAATVGPVLQALIDHPAIDEVIAVNDGSTDRTLSVLKQYSQQISVVDLKENSGKGAAVYEGINRSTCPIVMLIDADLINFSAEHISELLSPIQDGWEAVIGHLSERQIDNFTIKISGQRVYYRQDLLPLLPEIKNAGYGLELLLNKKLSVSTKIVVLEGLGHVLSHQKSSGVDKKIKYYFRWVSGVFRGLIG